MSRCQTRIGSVAGTVSGFWSEPPAYTRRLAKDGMNLLTGSVSCSAPSS